jgi:hypothetical protein
LCVYFLLCSERREKLHADERFTRKRTGQAQICSTSLKLDRNRGAQTVVGRLTPIARWRFGEPPYPSTSILLSK